MTANNPTVSVQAEPGRPAARDLVIIAVVILVLGLPTLLVPFGRDQGYFAVIGDRILQGQLPYRDVWDQKPPGIFYTYALAQHVLGHGTVPIHVFDLLSTLLTAAVVYLLGLRLMSRRQALLAACLYGLLYFSVGYWCLAEAESFAGLPMVLAVFLLHLRRPGAAAVAGLLLGITLIYKHTFVLTAAALLLVLLLQRRPLDAVLTAALCLVPPAAVWWYFGQHPGGQEALWQAVIEFTREHGRSSFHPLWLYGYRTVVFFVVYLAVIPLISVPAFYRSWQVVRTGQRSLALVVAWLVAGVLIVLAQGKFYLYQQVILYPPLTLLAAPAIPGLVARLRELPRQRLTPALVGVLLLFALTVTYFVRAQRESYYVLRYLLDGDGERFLSRFDTCDKTPENVRAEVAAYLRDHTSPADSIYIFGWEADVYYLAQRWSPSRFFFSYPLVCAWRDPTWRDELLQDLRRSGPAYFVVNQADDRNAWMPVRSWDSFRAWPELAAWVDTHYRLDQRIATFVLYRRKPGREHLERSRG